MNRDELINEIAALTEWVEGADSWRRLALLWPCGRCKAPVGEPCVTRRGELYYDRSVAYVREYLSGRYKLLPAPKAALHMVRADKGAAAFNSVMPRAWHCELESGVALAVLAREVRSSRLYCRLVELDQLKAPGATNAEGPKGQLT